jgi:hypothetical protein
MRLLLLRSLLACGDDKEETGSADGGAEGTSDGGADGGGGDTGSPGECEDIDGDAGTPEAAACAAAGGVCVGEARLCTGEVAADVHDCVFSDGVGACCVPPAAEPEGDSCAALGGTCAMVGGCYLTDSWFVDDGGGCSEAWGASATCCAPQAACEDYSTELCCNYDESGAAMTAYMPLCSRGETTCFEGLELVCEADCQP